MKKSVLLFVAVVAFSAASYAQGVSFGVKAGVNIANQKFTFPGGSLTGDARVGFHVGGFVTAMFSDQFGLQPELLFNSVGVSGENFDGDKVSEAVNYLSIPVLFRYQPIEILNIHAGPQVGFLLSAKAEDVDTKEAYKGLDLGAAVGAGVDLPMGLGFTARYVLGLANAGETESDEVKLKNNVFQISVSYRFGGN